MTVQMIHIQGETHLSVTIPDFDNEVLHADFHIGHPVDDESLNVVIPRSRDIFQFTANIIHYQHPVLLKSVTNGTISIQNIVLLFSIMAEVFGRESRMELGDGIATPWRSSHRT